MSDSIKDTFNKESLIKDIGERENIISNYQKYGVLDRDNAIKKIQELRISDKDVAAVTSIKLVTSSIPFSQSTNDQIIGELTMQKDILLAKLNEKQSEELK